MNANERVALRAEQEGRSFKWLLSRALAEKLAPDLRERGWTVTLEDEVRVDGRE